MGRLNSIFFLSPHNKVLLLCKLVSFSKNVKQLLFPQNKCKKLRTFNFQTGLTTTTTQFTWSESPPSTCLSQRISGQYPPVMWDNEACRVFPFFEASLRGGIEIRKRRRRRLSSWDFEFFRISTIQRNASKAEPIMQSWRGIFPPQKSWEKMENCRNGF